MRFLSGSVIRRCRALTPLSSQFIPNAARVNFLCTTSDGKSTGSNDPTLIDDEGAGRDLAKLSKIASALRGAIEKTAREQRSHPETLISLEQDINEANTIIKAALDKAGRPCTVEELADRIDRNTIQIPTSALDYKDLLRAYNLRDSIEDALVALNVMPPLDTLLDGSNKPFCRLDRKALREKEKKKEMGIIENEEGIAAPEEQVTLTELRPVSEEELALRRAYMERATTMEEILRGYDTALLEVGRVHKVVKGGTTMSMRALVVIGNRNGTAGYGEGKSDTAQHAIERACRDARRNMLNIDLYQNRTIYHRVKGKYVKSLVTMWPAPKGTGITASNNFSAVLQLFGLKDVGAKLHGPRCLSNAVKALFNALSNVESPQSIAAARGLQEITKPSLLELSSGKRRRLKSL